MRSHDRYRRVLVLIVASFLSLVVVVVLFEEKLIYFPSDDFDVTPRALGLVHEELTLTTEDGVGLHAWFLPAPAATGSETGPTILVCHGNAGNISHRLDRVLAFHAQLGADVLLFDYRGFGRSGGRPTEEGTYRDAHAAYRYLVEARSIEPERIVLFGESLGAAVALTLATEAHAAALVLEAPFTSIREMAKHAYPLLPLSGLVRTRYDNLAKIASIDMPVLVIHGTDDPTVPFAHGERVYRAAAEPKEFLPVEGAGHSDVFAVAGESYWRAFRRLLRRVSPAR